MATHNFNQQLEVGKVWMRLATHTWSGVCPTCVHWINVELSPPLADHSLSAVLRCSIAWNNNSNAAPKGSGVRSCPLHSWYTRVLSALAGGRGGERRRRTEHPHTQGQGMHSQCVQVCDWDCAMCVYMVSSVTMCVYGNADCVYMDEELMHSKWDHTWLLFS